MHFVFKNSVLDTIEKGIPVKGYFAWTLMDNYEWAEGYKPESCFGLVHMDRKTMRRIPKRSFFWYKEVIKNHLI
jgi:beta-glucosidase